MRVGRKRGEGAQLRLVNRVSHAESLLLYSATPCRASLLCAFLHINRLRAVLVSLEAEVNPTKALYVNSDVTFLRLYVFYFPDHLPILYE